MKIKKGDSVKVLAGKDRGKSGKVTRCAPRRNKIIVEGLNIIIQHRRPRRQGEKGQRIEVSAPLVVSKVQVICPKCGKPARIGFKIMPDKSKKRLCRKCKQTF